MPRFIFLIREDLSKYPRSPQEMKAIVDAHVAWGYELSRKGIFVDGKGIGMDGRLIEMINGDKIVQPIRDVHEGIGGYYIIEADDLTAAVEIAKGCPTYKEGDLVEVRPLST